MLKYFLRFGLVVAGIVALAPASHGAFTASAGGSALAGQQYVNFDNVAVGSTSGTSGNLSFAGGMILNGTSTGDYEAPILSGSNNLFFEPTTTPGRDATNYIATGGGSVTFTFLDGPKTYFGLLWGSIDVSNSLTFYNGGSVVGTVTGADLLAFLNVPAGNNTAYVNITFAAFDRVVASNPAPSFELDNVAFGQAVPEPSSLALCGVAGLIGLVARRRFR